MLKCKMAIMAVISSIFLVVSLGQAVTATRGSVTGSSTSSQSRMMKVIGFISKMENNVLYLENNQRYDLRNVSVTDLSGSGNRVSTKKRTAEMLFVNGVLREVVIR
ncbi:MAG: hypothetical protein V1766_12045 [Pseudomonadota bacterium]